MTRRALLSGLVLAAAALPAFGATAQLPAAIDVPGATTVATFHAVGAQLYECKAGTDGKLAWAFREPIASLILDGKTVGRHFAGPTWEDTDGSAVVAKASGNAPGKTKNDVAWLKLDVTNHSGSGVLADVATVQRINTSGGSLQGKCNKAGDIRAVPYSADYVFLRK